MKKSLFYAGTLLSAMFVAACSKNEVPSNEVNNGSDGQTLSLVLNTGGNKTSRAGRPLLSSAAMQDIDNVTLYVVNSSNKLVLKKVLGEATWDNAIDYDNNEGHGKEILVSFKKSDKQNLTLNSEYTIYAVGYTGTKNSDYTFTPAEPDKVEYNTTNESGHADWSDFKATINTAKSKGEEVFAGSVEVKVVEENGKEVLKAYGTSAYDKEPNLMLYRQVAGVTGYFTSIPVYPLKTSDASTGPATRYVRLVASAMNQTVLFQDLNNASATTQTGTAAKAVMNGTNPWEPSSDASFQDGTQAYEVYTIDLHEFFPQGVAASDIAGKATDESSLFSDNADGYIDHYDVKKWLVDNTVYDTEEQQASVKPFVYKDFWRNPKCWNPAGLEIMPYPQSLVRGSVWGAEFVIPFAHTNTHRTFELQLLDKDKNILKTYNVNIPSGDMVKNSSASTVAIGTTLEQKYDVSESIYNVYRNHMYSLGMKSDNVTDPIDPIDPTDPTDPTDPEEKPEGLNGGQDLVVKVNDNWEIIHEMEID